MMRRASRTAYQKLKKDRQEREQQKKNAMHGLLLLDESKVTEEKKEEKVSPSHLDKLSQQTLKQIFSEYLSIADWMLIKPTSHQWYQHIFSLIKKFPPSTYLTSFLNVPYRLHIEPTAGGASVHALQFLSQDKSNPQVVSSVNLPANVNPNNPNEVRVFANAHLIQSLGWDSTADSLNSLLNILVYMRTKKVIEHSYPVLPYTLSNALISLRIRKKNSESFIQQAVRFFNDSARLAFACRYDRAFAWLVFNSPLRNKISAEEQQITWIHLLQPQNRMAIAVNTTWTAFRAARNSARQRNDIAVIADYYIGLELMAVTSITMLMSFRSLLKGIDQPHNPSSDVKWIMKTIASLYAGLFVLFPTENILRNYFTNLYYDADFSAGNAVARHTREHPALTTTNFLKGNAYPFFKHPKPLRLQLTASPSSGISNDTPTEEHKETKQHNHMASLITQMYNPKPETEIKRYARL